VPKCCHLDGKREELIFSIFISKIANKNSIDGELYLFLLKTKDLQEIENKM